MDMSTNTLESTTTPKLNHEAASMVPSIQKPYPQTPKSMSPIIARRFWLRLLDAAMLLCRSVCRGEICVKSTRGKPANRRVTNTPTATPTKTDGHDRNNCNSTGKKSVIKKGSIC